MSGQSTKPNTGLKPPWKPGQSGNPGGRPKGTISGFSKLVGMAGELLSDPTCSKSIMDELKRRATDAPADMVDDLIYPLILKVSQKVEIGAGDGLAEALAELCSAIGKRHDPTDEG